MRAWQKHDVGGIAPFEGDVEAALGSIKVPVLCLPSETDLYFPLTDARYEAAFLAYGTPVPSLWGHLGGAGLLRPIQSF